MNNLKEISHPMGVGILEWPGLRSHGYKSKTLMFFADIHNVYAPCKPCTRPACLKFPEFVKTLLRETNQCIDVFIEDFPYHGKKKGGYRGYRGTKGSMCYTRYKLRKYRPAKEGRKMFRYGRIHFTDLRIGSLGIEAKKIILGASSPRQSIRRLFRFIRGVSDGTLLKDNPVSRRIARQVHALPSSIRTALLKTFATPGSFPLSYDPYPYTWLKSRHEWAAAQRDLRKPMSSYAWRVMIGLCLSPLYDIYTLARLFKPVFKTSRVAISYSGGYHAAKMIRFCTKSLGAKLTYLKPRLENFVSQKEPQCLQIKGKFKDTLGNILRKKGETCKVSRRVFGRGEVSTPIKPK